MKSGKWPAALAVAVEYLERRRLLWGSAGATVTGAAKLFDGAFAGSIHLKNAAAPTHASTHDGLLLELSIDLATGSASGSLAGTGSFSELGAMTLAGGVRHGGFTLDFTGGSSGVMHGRVSANGRMLNGTVTISMGGQQRHGSFDLTRAATTTGTGVGAAGGTTGGSSLTDSSSNSRGSSRTIFPTIGDPMVTSSGAGASGSSNSTFSGPTNTTGSSNFSTGGLGFAGTFSGSGVARGLPGIGGTVTGVQGGSNGTSSSVSGTSIGVTGLGSGLSGTATVQQNGNLLGTSTTNVTANTTNTVVNSTSPTTSVNAPGTVPGLITFPIPTAPVVVVGSTTNTNSSTSSLSGTIS